MLLKVLACMVIYIHSCRLINNWSTVYWSVWDSAYKYKQQTHTRSRSQLAACACAIQLNWKRNYLPFFSYIRARASCATRLHNLRQTALLLFCVFISCVLFTWSIIISLYEGIFVISTVAWLFLAVVWLENWLLSSLLHEQNRPEKENNEVA